MKAILAAVVIAVAAGTANAGPRIVDFSGFKWTVKNSADKVGPGPNYFSAGLDNVWVDDAGRLHLKITHVGDNWFCAELGTNDSLGFGTYRFYLDSEADALDPNAVLGLFTWSDKRAFHHREIDIELSRWGYPDNRHNAQFVVQPFRPAGHIHRFLLPPGYPQTLQSFNWSAGAVAFRSLIGHDPTPPDPSYFIQRWTATDGIPPAGDEHLRMNLWLYQGHAPAAPVEVIVKRFAFPAP
jgi:hypothetical protein